MEVRGKASLSKQATELNSSWIGAEGGCINKYLRSVWQYFRNLVREFLLSELR
jgi:hypothetical protein